MAEQLDHFDIRLLEMLQVDAEIPAAALAEAVGLSAPSCYRRIRRLREIGAIEKQVAVVSPKLLGWGLSMTVLVTLEREGSRTVADLMRKWIAEPCVREVLNVTGDYDLAVSMVARDMEDYDAVVQRLFSDDERVRTFKTLVVMKRSKSAKPLSAA